MAKASTSKKPKTENNKFIALFLIIVGLEFVLFEACNGYNIDNWYMITTGSYITENGIPYVNPFAPEGSNLAIVIQQWLYCVLFNFAYSLGGWHGVGILHILFNVLAIASIGFVAKAFTEEKIRLIMTVGTAAGICLMAWAWRPHSLSVAMICFLIGLLERYRKDPKPIYLALLPLVVLIHANVHISLAPIDIFVILLYVIPVPTRLEAKVENGSYPRILVLLAALVSAAALFANPYGLDGVMYTVNSMDAAGYGHAIVEMGSVFVNNVNPLGPFVIVVAASLSVLWIYTMKTTGKVNIPVSLFWLFAVAASLMATRNIMFMGIASIGIVGTILNMDIKSKFVKVIARFCGPAFLVAFIAFVGITAILMSSVGMIDEYGDSSPDVNIFAETGSESTTEQTPVAGIQAIENAGAQPGDPVMTFSYNGGYISTKGYRITADSRPELWDSTVTKNPNCTWHHDYTDASLLYRDDDEKSLEAANKVLSAYDCKWLIIWAGDTQMLKALDNSENWEKIADYEGGSAWKNLDYQN